MQQGTRSRWTKKKERPENNIAQELNELIVLLHTEKHIESIHHIIIVKRGKHERRRKKVPELSKWERGKKYPAQKYHRIADDGKRTTFCTVYWI